MDDRLLDLDRQDESDYPKAFLWGAKHVIVYPGWTLIEDTIDLKNLKSKYGLKFYKFFFDTNAYYLTLTFHDLDIKPIKRIEK